jgi:hypothetical protein
MIAADPLMRNKETNRLDLKVGERVEVGGRVGVVRKVYEDPVYPVGIWFDGDSRETRPIYHSILRAR